MNKNNKPLVSAAELEALMADWSRERHPVALDVWFPLRYWFLALTLIGFALWALFDHHALALSLSSDPLTQQHLQSFLYFRGWFMLGIVALASYSYFRAWYPALRTAGLLLVGVVNLVFDLFTLFPERLAQPTPSFTLIILLRLLMLWLLWVSFRNAGRLPAASDRWKPWLPRLR